MYYLILDVLKGTKFWVCAQKLLVLLIIENSKVVAWFKTVNINKTRNHISKMEKKISHQHICTNKNLPRFSTVVILSGTVFSYSITPSLISARLNDKWESIYIPAKTG